MTAAQVSVSTGLTTRERTARRRQRILGIVYLLIAVAIVVGFGRDLDPATESRFVLKLGDAFIQPPDILVPSGLTLYLLGMISGLAGAVQLIRGFGTRGALVLGLVAVAFVLGFFTWVAAGQSVNLTGVLQSSIQRSVPIVFGALSGVLCERSGVVNIAIEGMLLGGACTSAVVGSITGDPWIAIASAMLVGGLLALLLAVLAIRYFVDQIIAGFVINILATGLTSFLAVRLLQPNPALNSPPRLPIMPIPLLSDIPVLGPILFRHNLFVYTVFILVIVIWFALYRTRWGLRVRAVGEHPKAADTVGINVNFIRYRNVVLGGIVAGLGGAYFTIGSTGAFEREMTAGRGFIGLAAMIFGGWNPIGGALAALVFGFADAVQARASVLNIPIPSEILLSVPYIVTIIVVAGLIGRVRMPAADGQPYKKE
jgi:simple sugar transport system permease protein